MQTQLTSLAHIALTFGQSASFLFPESKVAIKLATAFVGMDSLVQIFFPGTAPPPPATEAEMAQGFKDLASTVVQTAWNTALRGHIGTVRKAVEFHDSAFNDFKAGKFGQTPSAQLTGTLAQDWKRVYDSVKSYADLSDGTYTNPLLDVRDWVLNDALADAKAAADDGRVKWLQFELLPLYCSATAAYISFCKLALMIELHEAMNADTKGSPTPNRDIMPDDFLGLVPSPYFENVEQILNSTTEPYGCIKQAKDTLDAYTTESAGLASDITWRKGRISVVPAGGSFQIHDAEANWDSQYFASQIIADTQLALYAAQVLGAYATDQGQIRGVGGLSAADAKGLTTLYQTPWDQLRRDLLKNRRKWDAKNAPSPPGGPG